MPPEEKLKKYFGIEINRQLFEDAMSVVQLRIQELNKLETEVNGPKIDSAAETLNIYSGSFWNDRRKV